MNAKEYLSQALAINKRIDSKLEQVSSLRSLAMRVTTSFGEERVCSTKKQSPLEEAMVKLIDLEHEINDDIDKLLDIKKQIAEDISSLENENYRMILELRYVALMKWEDIAETMDYDLRWVYRMHGKALKEFDKPLKATIKV
ncbi:DUF1492 domain-containing protein [Tissierella carlieri]|uniref:DUF1492 domain-containing protein n=1 Tax=Tissierella carlieri TaxID=689904 RepID=A0ABT1S6V3_9FIRM|nr:DUF1492 domain-containing protein [Tissierella carlieri]MCQ4922212.1 DUF1492 domain-containing protein [Tissierella carlieri]